MSAPVPSRSRRLLRALGLGPLLGFVVYHLWEHWPIRHGRSEVLARLETRFASVPVAVEALLVVLPLVVHAGVGIALWRGGRAANLERARASAIRNQRAAALLLGGFLVWHLASLWWPARVEGQGALAAAALAEAQLASVVGSLAYVIGWSALAVHLGYGLRTSLIAGGQASSRWALLTALALSLAVWLVGINVLAAYVAGAPIW